MKYNGVIQRKLALLDERVGRLESYMAGRSFESFEADWVARSATERGLQVCAEVIIDVAERIIALEDAGPVASAADAVKRLQSLGVIADAESYVGIVRLRNLIVHEYEEIEPRILFDLPTGRLSDFRRFRDEIDRAG